MALLPITLYGDKILRKKAKKVEEVDYKTIELIKNMFDTMRNAHGVGLAANQVGSDKSIFVVDISVIEGCEHIKPMAFINPRIIFFSEEKSVIEEGCLSIPDVRFDIARPELIKIAYQDTDLIEHELEADDHYARVLQHEYDHLQGVLFTDRVTEKQRSKIVKDLKKIRERDLEFEYPVTDNTDYQLK
jgi:peptide deformylase